MVKFLAPEQFNFAKPEDQPEWKQCFSRYWFPTKLNKEPPEVQVSELIYSMGPEAEQVYKSFAFEDKEEANDYDDMLGLFNRHFVLKWKLIFERAQFHSQN